MKTTSFILALVLSISLGKAQNAPQVSYFPLQNVKLLDSPFLQAQQTDLHYILALDPDRLLAPFLREAGLQPKAPSYTNWENTGLDGHIGGHYLSALSMMYAATGDTAVYNRLNYMLNELNRAQQTVGTGFIGGTPGSLSTLTANGCLYTIYIRLTPDCGMHISMQEATLHAKCLSLLQIG